MSILKSLIKYDKEILKKTQKKYLSDGYSDDDFLIVGVDEVGRGSFAGPLCTGAYSIFDFSKFAKDKIQKLSNERLELLNDSKKVAHKKREELCSSLKKYPQTLWSIDFQPADEVDKIGIVNCIWNSMTNNLKQILGGFENLTEGKFPKVIVVLVDGPKTILGLEMFLLSEYGAAGLEIVEQISVVKGDSKSAMIAAASNIAKEIRDNYMKDLAKDFPEYAWDTNVGYGTEVHRQAIDKFGPCQHHRMSFLKKMVLSNNSKPGTKALK